MSKKQKNRQKQNPARLQAGDQTSSLYKFAVLAVIALAGVMVGVGIRRITQPQPPVATNDSSAEAPASEAEQTSELSSPAAAKKTVFESILGKWVRSEGGYVLDIQTVDAKGKLTAEYLNPRPVHIARAEATRPGAAIKVFVELQDVNYPGSTYELTYDPASDRLQGVYFQAVEQQSFEVTFSRAEEKQ